MNWGILGCASIASRSVIPAILSVEGNRLIAVASRSKSKAVSLATRFNCIPVEGYDALFNFDNIDAVYIPLPTGMHFEWVMKALRSGKHVLVEKSAAVCLDEAKEMVALARDRNLALIENFQFLHHVQNSYVKELLAEDEIGEIRCFRSAFGFPPFELDNNIRYQPSLGGGALLDCGAYALRATSYICGPGFEVRAATLLDSPRYKVDWYGGAFLTHNEKRIFSEVAFGFDNYYQCNYEIWGSKGKITSTRAFTAKPGFVASILLDKEGKTQEILLPPDDHFQNMIRHFNQTVEDQYFETEYVQMLEQSRLISEVRHHSNDIRLSLTTI
jgi:NDP-hexose-3-ketoreductase